MALLSNTRWNPDTRAECLQCLSSWLLLFRYTVCFLSRDVLLPWGERETGDTLPESRDQLGGCPSPINESTTAGHDPQHAAKIPRECHASLYMNDRQMQRR
jgi:hypothetical protein